MYLQFLIGLVEFQFITGQITFNLTFPPVGNCGNDTVMTCQFTNTACTSWGLNKDGAIVLGPGSTDFSKYSYTGSVASGTIRFTIKSMKMTDAAAYVCSCRFDNSPAVNLTYECKPKNVTQLVTSAKKLSLSVDQVFPKPTQMSVTLNNSLSGNHKCISSLTMSSHYSCTWTSSSSLEDVDSSYRITVTTVTQTALTGYIKIATPGPPIVTNREQLPDGRSVIRATENSAVSLTCVSHGGIPAPTVAWYRDSISTTPFVSTSTGELQEDGTYRVALVHTRATHRSDDLRTFVCRSYYPQATSIVTQGSRETPVQLYLALKPSKPTVTQTNTPVSGGTVALECKTSGGRPAPNVSWTYGGQTYTPSVQASQDPATETYSLVSTLKKPVTAADNGQQATCHVSHLALTLEMEGRINLTVQYVTVTATNTTTLSTNATVTCTLNNIGDSYDSQPWVQEWLGYGEVSRRPFSPLLTLTQLTYEYTGWYTCKVKASGDMYAEGKTFLLVKSPPVIVSPETSFDRYAVFVRLYHNATVSVQYFSNVPGSDVKCYRINHGIRSTTPEGNIVQSEFTVQLPVFSQMVPTPGTMATVTLMVHSEADFDDYDIVITNGIGEGSYLPITLNPTRPPDKPTNIQIVTTRHDGPLLLWEPGFDGGSNQSFVIQTSKDGVSWTNNTHVDDGMSGNYLFTALKSIQTPTLFFVRMFSYNTDGRSDFSDVLNFTSFNAESEELGACELGDLIGGVVGSLLVGVLLGLGIFFLLVRYQICNTNHLISGAEENLKIKFQKRERVEISPGEDINQETQPGELRAEDQAIGLSPVTYEELSSRTEDKQHYESLNTSENAEKVYYNIPE